MPSAVPQTTVVLLGKGELAIRIGEWFLRADAFQLSAVVPVIPEPTWTASLRDWSGANGLNVIASGDYRDLDLESIDLAFSVFYDKILPADFIRRCGRVLNLHNGPLPRYRGVTPINWALKNGECDHGVTIHEITPGIDDGPIVAQATYSIYPEFDEVRDVYARALTFGYALFEETMPILDRITPRRQDESAASYYSAADAVRLGERRLFTREESARS